MLQYLSKKNQSNRSTKLFRLRCSRASNRIRSVSSNSLSNSSLISFPTGQLEPPQLFFLPRTWFPLVAFRISDREMVLLGTINLEPPSFPFLLTTQPICCNTASSLRTMTGLICMLSAIQSELDH